jgi:hypothetical protein
VGMERCSPQNQENLRPIKLTTCSCTLWRAWKTGGTRHPNHTESAYEVQSILTRGQSGESR